MTEKRLQVDSMYAHLDTNKDGIVSDHELMIKERMIKLENQDKKEDQIRLLIWFNAISVTVFVGILMIPDFISISRLDHLSNIGSTWVIASMGIISSYVLGNAIINKKDTK